MEATSAYILITSLRSENLPPTMEHILARWTVSAEQLDQALAELLARGVINRKSAQDGQNLYFPNPSSLWRSRHPLKSTGL